MSVMTTNTRRAHDHGSDETDAVTEDRRGSIDEFLVGILTQAFERVLLKFIKLMRRAVFEGEVRNKAVTDIFLLCANNLAQFQ